MKFADLFGQGRNLVRRRFGFFAEPEKIARQRDQDRRSGPHGDAPKTEAGKKLRKLLRQRAGSVGSARDLDGDVLDLEAEVLKPAASLTGRPGNLGERFFRLVPKALHCSGTLVPDIKEGRFDFLPADDPKANGNLSFSHLPRPPKADRLIPIPRGSLRSLIAR